MLWVIVRGVVGSCTVLWVIVRGVVGSCTVVWVIHYKFFEVCQGRVASDPFKAINPFTVLPTVYNV